MQMCKRLILSLFLVLSFFFISYSQEYGTSIEQFEPIPILPSEDEFNINKNKEIKNQRIFNQRTNKEINKFTDNLSINRNKGIPPAEENKENEEEKEQEEELSPIEEAFLKRTKNLDIKLRQFGYDFFKGKPQSSNIIPNIDSYVLGPGDEIIVYPIGASELLPGSITLKVDREGNIYIPDVGVFYVWGLTLKEVEELISGALGINVRLSLGKIRTFNVYVTGEVNKPGNINLSKANSLVDALILAGGIKKTGSLRNIIITKKSGRRIRVDLYRLLVYGKPIDVELDDGDVILVKPIGKTIGIAGKVKRPAIYEILGNERIKDIIELAGGLLPHSYKYKAILQRYEKNKYLKIIEGNLSDRNFINLRVKDGDLLVIKSIVNIPVNAIEITGYTPYPGVYEYKPGMMLSDILTEDMFFKDTNTKFALIKRIPKVGKTYIYISFAPEEILEGKRDIRLVPGDIIILYKFGEVKDIDFNKVKDVFLVEGEIKYTGPYAYTGDNKLSDIVTYETIKTNTNLDYGEIERKDENTLETKEVIVFSPREILQGKKDIKIKRLDIIRFYPRFIHDPITVSGYIYNPYKLPYRDGLTLSQALTFAKFKDRVENLKVEVFRKKKDKKDTSDKQDIDKYKSIIEKEYLDEAQKTKKEKDYSENQQEETLDKDLGKDKLLNLIEKDKEETNIEKEKELEEDYIYSAYLYDLLIKRDEELDIKLKPGDRIVVKPIQKNELVRKVYIYGYVYRPGVYSLNDIKTLYDLLKKAGGFREKAYPKGIVVLRESVRKLQEEKIKIAINLMKQYMEKEEVGILQSDLGSAEKKARETAFKIKKKLIEEIEEIQVTGRIAGLNIPRNIELLKGTSSNIELEDGDMIYVPRNPNTVLVFGEVFNPAAFIYNKNLTVRDYINLSGGLTRFADKENIFVIKANGLTLSSQSENNSLIMWDNRRKRFLWGYARVSILDYKPEPGDAIIVPTKIKVPIMWRPLLKDVLQIIYQSLLSVYIIKRL